MFPRARLISDRQMSYNILSWKATRSLNMFVSGVRPVVVPQAGPRLPRNFLDSTRFHSRKLINSGNLIRKH